MAARCKDLCDGKLDNLCTGANNSFKPDLKFESISFVPSGEYDITAIVEYRPTENEM